MSQPTQLLCSTGAFSRFPDFTSYQQALQYAPQLEVDGFELMFYPVWYSELEQVATALRKSGRKFPAMHAEKGIGEALSSVLPERREQAVHHLEANCKLGSLIGTQVLVLHLWGLPELDDNLENNLQPLSHCLDIAAQYDMELTIETIPARRSDPLSNVYTAWARDARCRIALDTEFLALHQQLTDVFAADWLWQNQLVRHVHIKDFDGDAFPPSGRRYLHPGEGYIDFSLFFRQLKQHDFKGFISLEAPAIDRYGHVEVKKLQASLDLLRDMLSL